MTRHPQPVRWPRWAAVVIEAFGVALVVGLLALLAVVVGALAAIDTVRPLLAVASGFAVGAFARLCKEASGLTATYCTRRRELLDQFCTRLELRRTQRQTNPATTDAAAPVPGHDRPAGAQIIPLGRNVKDRHDHG